MPTVPRYEEPRVSRQARPGVRISGDAPASAFMPVKPIDASAVTDVVGQIVEQEIQAADQIALTEAQAQLSALETSLLYGKGGALNREGKNAFTAPEEIND